jgi:hypothetical protein
MKETLQLLSSEGKQATKFCGELLQATIRRRFCVLRTTSIGLMLGEARHGDLAAAFLGAQVLFRYTAASCRRGWQSAVSARWRMLRAR